MLPYYGEAALYRRHPMGPSSTLFWSPVIELYDLWVPLRGLSGASVVLGPTLVGTLVGRTCPWPGWLPSPALWQDWLWGLGGLVLVPAHWWVGQGMASLPYSLNIYLFIWLHWVLVAAGGLLSCGSRAP